MLVVSFFVYKTETAPLPPVPTESSRQVLYQAPIAQPSRSLPDRLKIPKIHIDAAIQQVGLTASGAMDVPTNSTDVGWLKTSTIPGDVGSAVIDGHLDSRTGSAGIFQYLRDLRVGDKVYIQDRLGVVTTFVVWQTKTYEPNAEPPEVFNVSDGVHLNLITCTGIWDVGKQNYGKRLVVFTSLEKSTIN